MSAPAGPLQAIFQSHVPTPIPVQLSTPLPSAPASEDTVMRTADDRSGIKRSGSEANFESSQLTKKTDLVEWAALNQTLVSKTNDQGLLSNDEAFDVAEEIAITDPLLLNNLSFYSHDYILESIDKNKDANTPPQHYENIKLVVSKLHLICLENSQAKIIAIELNRVIDQHLVKTQKGYIDKVIMDARYLLGIDLNQVIHCELYKKDLLVHSQIMNQLLSLFCYGDSNYYDAIRRISDHLRLGNCQKHLPLFIQQLALAQNERKELIILNSQLTQRLFQVTEKLKSIIQANSPPEPQVTEKSIFFHDHYELFWNLGIKIIHNVFKASMIKAGKDHTFILPKDFKSKINSAARKDPNWGQYNLTVFVRNPELNLDLGYLNNLWTEYSGNDPEDLMTKYIDKLSDAEFQTLKAGLEQTKEQDKKDYLASQIEPKFKVETIVTLKDWCKA